MNDNTFLIITSIAPPNEVLQTYARESESRGIRFILIGDTKSPENFSLSGCEFWGIEQQQNLPYKLAKHLPKAHYARKNIGYLRAIEQGADIIVETDDDNYPRDTFWQRKELNPAAHLVSNGDWVNVYKYFTDETVWPRGFALQRVNDVPPDLHELKVRDILCPIQQGLCDENPDVDAIYRLVRPLPLQFRSHGAVAIGKGSWCPFNSQNTSWFREAFPLLYLPASCSFRMTDIWRSFIAQRIAWTCGWNILFHEPTVVQERNVHDLMKDFHDEIPGYLNNASICRDLAALDLKPGEECIPDNLSVCYRALVEKGYFEEWELTLLEAWIEDLASLSS